VRSGASEKAARVKSRRTAIFAAGLAIVWAFDLTPASAQLVRNVALPPVDGRAHTCAEYVVTYDLLLTTEKFGPESIGWVLVQNSDSVALLGRDVKLPALRSVSGRVINSEEGVGVNHTDFPDVHDSHEASCFMRATRRLKVTSVSCELSTGESYPRVFGGAPHVLLGAGRPSNQRAFGGANLYTTGSLFL
jgi:hypothetical protein